MAVYTTASHSWAVGETVTAANMNGQLRDFINGFGAWSSYTPAWTSTGTAPALGNGTLVGTYTQVGKLVIWRCSLNTGSTTTYGTGAYAFSLPVSTRGGLGTDLPMGVATCTHAGARYLTEIFQFTTTTVTLLTQAAAGASVLVQNTSPVTFASGDSINMVGWYEAA